MGKEIIKKELIKVFEQDLKRGIIPTIYSVVKHVSKSGMLRYIDFYYIGKDRQPLCLNFYIEQLGLFKRPRYNHKYSDSLKVGGCGMDMGFHVVYSLGGALPELAKYKIVTGRNGDKNPEKDTGYLLHQRWL